MSNPLEATSVAMRILALPVLKSSKACSRSYCSLKKQRKDSDNAFEKTYINFHLARVASNKEVDNLEVNDRNVMSNFEPGEHMKEMFFFSVSDTVGWEENLGVLPAGGLYFHE